MSLPRPNNLAYFPDNENRTPHIVRVSSIQPQRVDHLWRGRMAAGKMTILDGDPGLGKSTVSLDIAAAFSAGKLLPGETEPMRPQGVIVLSAEDGEADTIRPRLEVAGADLDRVHIMTVRIDGKPAGPMSIPKDLEMLEQMMEATRTGLVIIDPFMAFLDPERNANRDQDVRGALAPLAALLERQHAACLILRHLNKSLGSSPLYRGGGSVGIIGAARFGLIVAKDPEDDTGQKRILAPQKVNLAAEPPALRYRLTGVEGTDVARVEWLGEADITASKMLDAMQPDYERGVTADAKEWLKGALEDGPRSSTDIRGMAARDGIAMRTLERAKYSLSIKAHREGFGGNGRWMWSMPPGTILPKSTAWASKDA